MGFEYWLETHGFGVNCKNWRIRRRVQETSTKQKQLLAISLWQSKSTMFTWLCNTQISGKFNPLLRWTFVNGCFPVNLESYGSHGTYIVWWFTNWKLYTIVCVCVFHCTLLNYYKLSQLNPHYIRGLWPLKIHVILVGRLALLAGPARPVKMSQISFSKLHQNSWK